MRSREDWGQSIRIRALNEEKARRENRALADVMRDAAESVPVGRH